MALTLYIEPIAPLDQRLFLSSVYVCVCELPSVLFLMVQEAVVVRPALIGCCL